MISLPGYKITSKIYNGNQSDIYRARQNYNNQPVILKLLKDDYPSHDDLDRFNREYELLAGVHLEGVVKAFGIQNYRNSRVMILEDFGGEALSRIMSQRRVEWIEALEIAINILEIVGQVHAGYLIHKDLNPSNIIWNPHTGQIKLIDFGSATRLIKENPEALDPEGLTGLPAYISPEQTGRMNRSVDYRTDFYSLGVTFFEMFTGRLPFQVKGAMEWVHAHIAESPQPPNEINPKLSRSLSQIILKLMAKAAEDRYQSAFGVIADLTQCLEQLQKEGNVADFEIGTHDKPAELQISQQLYGREKELDTLLNAFDRVRLGKKELFLVAGASGVGKSALVREIHKQILVRREAKAKLRMISGKFDQYNRDIPYFPFIQAFRKLIRQHLTESKDQIRFWKMELLNLLGSNGQMIIDVIPEVELIIGPQPQVPELPPEESENRFHLMFQRFVQAFAAEDYPLAVFLDDLQWTDRDSLTLIEQLMTDTAEDYLFIIGAYRDNEVTPNHLLMQLLQKLEQKGVSITTVTLSPLQIESVTQLIADTLGTDMATSKPLAELCYYKTQGNPFFLKQLLHIFFKDRYLYFDNQKGRWRWDTEQIKHVGFTDNVVDLMSVKIQKLLPQTQTMVKIAACIGNSFDLKTLSIVRESTQKRALDDLWEALQEGLVVPVQGINPTTLNELKLESEVIFRFLHDRVQQAAYSLIDPETIPATHLKIGRLMLSNLTGGEIEEHLFKIANHLNQGTRLISERAEKDRVAEINYQAGKKARASAAFQQAFTFQMAALKLIDPDSWQRRYGFTLALYTEAAEAAYLHTDYETTERLAEVVLTKARTLLDKVKVYEIKIQAYLAQNQMVQALQTTFPILNQLGIKLPERPNRGHLLLALLDSQYRLLGKKPADLKHLPMISDEKILAAVRILSRMGSSAYLSAHRLYQLSVFKIISISVKYGNTDVSAIGYAVYGALVCEAWHRIDLAYQYGQLAMDLIERLNANKYKTRVYWLFNAFIRHRKEAVVNSLPSLIESYNSGLEVGDFEFAAYSAHCYIGHLFFVTNDLEALDREARKYGKGIAGLKQQTVLYWHQMLHQLVLNLMDEKGDPCRLVGEVYDENKMLPVHKAAKDNHALFTYHYQKSFLYYTFQKFDKALLHTDISRKYLSGGLGSVVLPLFYFNDALARLALYPELNWIQRKRHYLKIIKDITSLKKWARHAPMNYLQKVYLVEAERYRIIGNDRKAIRFYDLSIEMSRQNGILRDEALGNELAARYWLRQGKDAFAQLYMIKAHYQYKMLKMGAKVIDLESAYSDLLKSKYTEDAYCLDGPRSFYASNKSAFDIESVIKASQAISGEIELDKLLDKLMQVAITNAGAKKGFLIMNHEGLLTVRAKATFEPAAANDSDAHFAAIEVPVDACHELPQGIIHYVSRTHENIVLNDAFKEGLFTGDIYVRSVRPRSILCMPIIHQGQLTGILYLENNLVPNAFTPKQVQVLNLLSSQAAIHIENAKLYTRYRSLYDNAVEGIFQTTLDGRFISANRAMARILGYDSPEELINSITNVAQQLYINAEDRKEFESRLHDNIRLSGFDTQCHRKDGSRIWISISARGVRDQNDNMLYYEGLIVDISERMEKEQAERERETAEAASLAKSRFLANMSHEIRTPMNAIIGMTDLALRMDVPPKLKEYLKTVDVASQSLLRLINDILDFSKIEAGKLEMENIPFALDAVMERIGIIFGETADQKGIQLATAVQSGVPNGLLGDPTRLGQILINLTGNAVKFTQEGRVAIDVRVKTETEDGIELLFTVTDTGVGIAHSQLERLFDAFTQSDESTARKYGGTGLGLAISKQLVEMMGGRIWVQSNPGQGTTFEFSARFGKAAAESQMVAGEFNDIPYPDRVRRIETEVCTLLNNQRLLIVEDNRINQKVALEILDTVGIEADVAESGQMALEALSKKAYDGILMDVQMPKMDGYETTRRIRKVPAWSDLPIIAMTAHALKGDKKRCIDAGMNDYVGKPIEPYVLFESLLKWLKPKKVIALKQPVDQKPKTKPKYPLPERIPGIDTELFFRRHRGKERLLIELLVDFRDYHAAIVNDIRFALDENKAYKAYQSAHTLKGLAGNIAANDLQEKAEALEQLLKSRLDREIAGPELAKNPEIVKLFDQLQEIVDQLLDTLGAIETGQSINMLSDGNAAEQTIAPIENSIFDIIEKLSSRLQKLNPIESETYLAMLKNALQGTGHEAQVDNIETHLSNFDFEQSRQALEKLASQLNVQGAESVARRLP